MRFTDNPELNCSNMDGADILAGTDVSVSPTADRKFTLAGLAKWLIETYAGSTIGGVARSIKAAIDTLYTNNATAIALDVGGYSSTEYIVQHGKTCELTFSNGGSQFSSYTSGMTIGTLPEGLRPSHVVYAQGTVRTASAWTSATFYPCAIRIDQTGAVQLFGKQSDVRTCSYINLTLIYTLA